MIFTGMFAVLCCANGQAAQPQVSNQENIQNNSFRHIENEVKQFEFSQKAQQLKSKQYVAKAQSPIPTEQDQHCLGFSKIQLEGVSLINSAEFIQYLQRDCLTLANLNELSKRIVEAYLNQGFVYTNVEFYKKDNELLVKVIEGKLTEIKGDSRLVNSHMLFPHLIGYPLKVQDLDQGLDQANRLLANQVTVDIFPKENGELILQLTNEEKNTIQGNISFDNSGSKSTGRKLVKANISWDSPLHFSDSLYLGVSSTVNRHLFNEHEKYNRSGVIFYSIPYGYWTLNLSAGKSKFRYLVQLPHNQVEQRGGNWFANLKIDRVIHRGTNHISSVYGQLSRISVENRFLNERLEIQSPNLTSVQLGFSHLKLLENGLLDIDFNYEKGLSILGADKRKADLPNPQYHKYELNLTFLKNHYFDSFLLRNTHRLIAQYSNDYLPAIKQFSLTDNYIVRGFDNANDEGEQGIALQNTLSLKYQPNQWTIEPRVGFDIGAIRAKNGCESGNCRKSAVGFSTGIQIAYKNWRADLQYALGRYLHNNDEANTSRRRSLLFSINYQF